MSFPPYGHAPGRRAPGRQPIAKSQAWVWTLALAVCLGIVASGCTTGTPAYVYNTPEQFEAYKTVATRIEEPDVPSGAYLEQYGSAAPRTIEDGPPKYLDLTLEQVVRLALQNSRVIRGLGVSVLDAPNRTPTRFDPAIQETNPGPGLNELRDIGPEAALAAFDASLAASVFFEKNDRALNNTFFGGGTRILQQDLGVFQKQISKRAATGTDFALRQTTTYDANNAPGNAFFSAWDTIVEGEFRHPLLRGGGVEFNRINGAAGISGVPSGVLIGRLATDIRLVDVETGVRDLVRDTEKAYWALYFAYRNLDTAVSARDGTLQVWRSVHALYTTGREGGEAENEAQVRELYHRLQEQVQVALSGGADSPETVVGDRQSRGVLELERQLRYLTGLPINDGCLIRPADEPPLADVVFDWCEVLIEALARRPELRKQKWEIKRTELELIAAKNFLLPRLDITGRYRWRGFGKDLLNPNRDGLMEFDNAYNTLTGGEFQEWTLGAELEVPLGRRHAHAKVKNTELRLAKNRSLLKEQERKVVQELSDAVARTRTLYGLMQTRFNRRMSARQSLEALLAKVDSPDPPPVPFILDAQRRLAESNAQYFAAQAEYARAVMQVHFAKGSLLDYNEIYLAEGPWPGKAYQDAARRDRLRLPSPGLENYTLRRSPAVSRGEHPQQMGSQTPVPVDANPLGKSAPQGEAVPPPTGVHRLPPP